ncbi:MAG TPA: GGDEF domain-containing protein, partial [Actinotalea sp.]|nr:GGDEF domain-containing protein [Actinotalea sp.]
DGIDAILDDAGRALVRVAASGADLPERFDLRMRRADDSWMILEMQVARLPAGWQGIGRDVTEIRTLQDQLASLALRDPLTGMANRRLLNVLLDTALQRCQRNGTFLVVSYLDLDDFKHVNDEHGHAAGDAVLQQVAQRLLGTVRGSDVVARLGGDEFIAVHEAAPATAPAIVERLSRALSAPYDLPDGHRVSCLPSIGTADSATYTTPAELIAAADGAMYTAKRAHRAGRSRQH